MKRICTLAILALTLCAPATFAASGGEWIGGGQAGVHIPTGDYGDIFKTGFVGGVFLDYMVSDYFGIGANADYHATKAQDEYVVFPVTDFNFTILNYGVHGDGYLIKQGVARPYVTAGLGAYSGKTEVKSAGVTNKDTETKFGFDVGAGLKLQPAGSPVGVGVEGAFHNITDAFTDENNNKKSATLFTVTARVSFSFSDVTQKKY